MVDYHKADSCVNSVMHFKKRLQINNDGEENLWRSPLTFFIQPSHSACDFFFPALQAEQWSVSAYVDH